MSLTIKELARVSVDRGRRWRAGEEWLVVDYTNALAGEVGEACNAAKKLRRLQLRMSNVNSASGRELASEEAARAAIAKEAADTVLYVPQLFDLLGIDMEQTLVEVFNEKSVEHGFPEQLGLINVDRAEPGADGSIRKAHYGDGEQPWETIVRLGWGAQFAAANVLKYLRRTKEPEHSLESARWYFRQLSAYADRAEVGFHEALMLLVDELTPDSVARLAG